jgi:excisionase family DNA binding protein
MADQGPPKAPRPLTSRQVADLFGVTAHTVGRWAEDGVLRSFKTPGGQRRFRQEDVDAFLSTQDAA